MTRPIHLFLLLAALALAATDASGQTVFRCGNSYAQQPCAGGSAVDASDPRSPDQAAVAGKVAAGDAKRAEALEKARLAQEKNAPKALVIGPQAKPEDPPMADAKDKPKAKPGKLEQFTAVEPRKPGEKKPKKKRKKKET